MRWGAVVPTNRPEKLKEFQRAWADLDVKWYIVHDEKPWTGIPAFIPRRTDMIRSWGIYLAWRDDVDAIISLDDDVLPFGALLTHYEQGFARSYPLDNYLSVAALTTSPHEMRGFPYRTRGARVALQYGGWQGSLDWDAVTALAHDPPESMFRNVVMPVPKGCALTGCAMNMAFRHDCAPLMWQLPLFEGRYNRFGDIWSGLFAKRVLDAMGDVVLINGAASVKHTRASDPFTNIQREAPGLRLNEDLWQHLPEPTSKYTVEAYREVTDGAYEFFSAHDPEYARHFRQARDEWLALFQT